MCYIGRYTRVPNLTLFFKVKYHCVLHSLYNQIKQRFCCEIRWNVKLIRPVTNHPSNKCWLYCANIQKERRKENYLHSTYIIYIYMSIDFQNNLHSTHNIHLHQYRFSKWSKSIDTHVRHIYTSRFPMWSKSIGTHMIYIYTSRFSKWSKSIVTRH